MAMICDITHTYTHNTHLQTHTHARDHAHTHTHIHTHTNADTTLSLALSSSLSLAVSSCISRFLSRSFSLTHSQTHAHKRTTHTIHTQEVSKALSTLLLTPAVLTAALQEHTAACGNMHIIRKSARKSPTISERAKYMYAHKSPWIMRQCSWQCSKSPRMYPVCAKEPLNMHFYSHSAL